MAASRRGTAASARRQELLRQWLRHYPRATAEALIGLEAEAVAADSAVVAADLSPAVAAGVDLLFTDFSHFTDLGAGVVAGLLARATVVAARERCQR